MGSVSGWIAGSSNAAAYWNGGSRETKPVVVINRRHVPTDPDKLEAYNEALLKAQQEFADLMYKTVPGVVAITSGVDDDDPNLLHDLQVFANFDVFVGHADVENPAVADKFWKWIDFEKYDKSEAFYGQVWAPKANIEVVKRMTSELGGAKFDVYPIEDIQG